MEVNEQLPFLPGNRGRRVLTDDFAKAAFDAVMEGGSYERARRILIKQGYINTYTRKPYTYMGVYLASLRYLCENCEELRPILMKRWQERENVYVSDDEWNIYIVNKARVILGNSSKRRFLDWIDNNPWARNYDYLYAKDFGLPQTSRK